MEEATTARLGGLIFGLVISLSFDFLVIILQIFINLVIFGAPIFAAIMFPKWFPQFYKQANRFSYLGIFLGALVTAAIIINRGQGFDAIAGILLIPLSIVYIIGYAIVIALLHNLVIHPENEIPSM